MVKVKVKVKTQPGKGGTKIAAAKVRVAPVRTDQAKRLRPIYKTRAELMIHIHSGERPQTFRPR